MAASRPNHDMNDTSNRATSVARLLDRLADGDYVVCVRKSERNAVWQVEVRDVRTGATVVTRRRLTKSMAK